MAAGAPLAREIVEDVNEPAHRLDRLLTRLSGSASLNGVKALIGGNLRGCSSAGECQAMWHLLLADAAAPDAAVVVGLPFGHGAVNMAFPPGAPVEVGTRKGTITWIR